MTAELISCSSKRRKLNGFVSLHLGWIIDIPVNAIGITGEGGTLLVRAVANGNHTLELLIHELIDGFRAMVRNVDAKLAHHLNRFRSDVRRRDSGTGNVESVTCHVPQQSFADLAPGGVAGADNQYSFASTHTC